MRVVQIEPGTDADLHGIGAVIGKAPLPAAVAMLPPMTATCGNFFFTHDTRSSTPCECPMRRVDDDDVDAGSGKRLDALVGIAAGPPLQRPRAGRPLSILARQRIFGRLENVLDG
jgi:hypothetical protein